MRKSTLLKPFLLILLIIVTTITLFIVMDKLLGFNNTEIFLERLGFGKKEDEIVDDLVVNVIETKQEIIEGFTTIILESNKELTIEENNRFNLILVSSLEDVYKYVVEVNTIPKGKSKVSFSVYDNNEIEQPISIEVNRIDSFTFLGKQYVEPWENYTYILDGNELLSLVDKSHRIINTYEPEDLVNLRENYINLYVNNEDFELRSEAAEYLNIMLAAMRTDINKNVVIASAFRSYNTQARVYSSYVLAGTPQTEVDKLSARPGFSEHQLGTVIDFTNEETNFEFTAEFDNTPAGRWLLDNSWKYGFVQTYPKGSELSTRYNYEAWHYRFIGVENAKELKESGLIFAEWIKNR